jgi:SAM-dependent methyltransferase
LLAAARFSAQQKWPLDWSAVLLPQTMRGIELQKPDLARARCALAEHAEFIAGDIRSVNFGVADAVVILDVLHFIDHASQLQVLQRARHALEPDGVLLLRVGDADGGWRFRLSVWVIKPPCWRATQLRVAYAPVFLASAARSMRVQQPLLPMSNGTLFANTAGSAPEMTPLPRQFYRNRSTAAAGADAGFPARASQRLKPTGDVEFRRRSGKLMMS